MKSARRRASCRIPSQPVSVAAHPTDVHTVTPRRLTDRHPWLYPVAVRAHQARRHAAWLTSGTSWATRAPGSPELPVRVKKHGSLLLRGSPRRDALQHNKVVNLRLASARTDGVVIRPGETFSFNKVVGNCTRRKGYLVGMRLSNGDAEAGVGGGICQLANLLHWMFLHSPLTVVERSEHSFDPFPDKNRVLPWGVGCSIAWNYVDLVVRMTRTFTVSSCTPGSTRSTCAASSARIGRSSTPTRSRRATRSSSGSANAPGDATRSGGRSSTAEPATPCARSCSSATAQS